MSPVLQLYAKIFLVAYLLAKTESIKIRDYCKKSCGAKMNLMCSLAPCHFGRHCGNEVKMILMEDEERFNIAHEINRRRDEIAGGDIPELTAEGAVDIRALTYSMELEWMAQCWANQCVETEANCMRSPTMEKICMVLYSTTDEEDMLKTAVGYWFSMAANITQDQIRSYYYTSITYTATHMIWGETDMLGCAKTQFGTNILLVCNLSPCASPGKPIFHTGQPCSKVACNYKYTSLIGTTKAKIEFDPPFPLGCKRLFDNARLLLTLLTVKSLF